MTRVRDRSPPPCRGLVSFSFLRVAVCSQRASHDDFRPKAPVSRRGVASLTTKETAVVSVERLVFIQDMAAKPVREAPRGYETEHASKSHVKGIGEGRRFLERPHVAICPKAAVLDYIFDRFEQMRAIYVSRANRLLKQLNVTAGHRKQRFDRLRML
jgi:hypothetical protein